MILHKQEAPPWREKQLATSCVLEETCGSLQPLQGNRGCQQCAERGADTRLGGNGWKNKRDEAIKGADLIQAATSRAEK